MTIRLEFKKREDKNKKKKGFVQFTKPLFISSPN